jgi:DNA processing protein
MAEIFNRLITLRIYQKQPDGMERVFLDPPVLLLVSIDSRIRSGMSVAAPVIEAGEYCGTRITCLALETKPRSLRCSWHWDGEDSCSPNTLIKQGARLVATLENPRGELPTDNMPDALGSGQNESPEPETASLFPDAATSPHEN